MSANDFVDACGFIPSSGGTGNFVVSTAVQGYQTPAAAGAVNGNVYSYRAESADKSQWEEGFGAYTSSGTTLARSTITANSSGGMSAISFGAGPNVFITAASADLKNASLLSAGTLADARLSSNVPLKNAANTFTASVTISGALSTALTLAGSGGTGGDLLVHRGNNSGIVVFGNSATSYLYFDGTNFNLSGTSLSTSAGVLAAKNTARAWVTFAGSTPTISKSFNVSSITRSSAGVYFVNFSTALADAVYCAVSDVAKDGSPDDGNIKTTIGLVGGSGRVPTTSGCPITVSRSISTGNIDSGYITLMVMD
jgi:hypothetical protein